LAVLAGGAVALAAGRHRSDRSSARIDSPAHVVLLAGTRRLIAEPIVVVGGAAGAARVRTILRTRLPAAYVVRLRRAQQTAQPDLARTQARIIAAARAGARSAQVAGTVVASHIAAPVIAQALRNNCESAALSILLAGEGRRVAQLRLQRALPRSGPIDPVGSGSRRVWGDPDQGFVGRPDGGGVAGGFGVYPPPVKAVAQRFGVRLDDLSGRAPSVIYRRLRTGRPVMAWVGLSDGPSGSWRSPTGKQIAVNFGEHTIVLNGVHADGTVEVLNPLRGTRERWSASRFEAMWSLLGRRALGA